MESFGSRMKYLREEKGLTQTQLAKLLFIDKSTIAKYETDKIQPSIYILKEVAKVFNVSTDYMLGLED